MREVLFKARLIEPDEWFHGHYYFDGFCEKHYLLRNETLKFEIDPETLCQWRGVDLSSKNVFDGDIVSIDYDEESHVEEGVTNTVPYLFVVWFNDDDLTTYLREFVIVDTEDGEMIRDYIEDYPISDMCNKGVIDGKAIGNIHDKEGD